jgi:hypothetical protein
MKVPCAISHPKRMEVQDFVLKKEGCEKPDRKMVTLAAAWFGNKRPYFA